MINTEYQSYKKTLISINRILKYESEMRKTFSENGFRKIKQALNIIADNIEKAHKNKDIKYDVKERALVEWTVNLFVEIALEKPITAIFRDLSSTYLLLVFNWNKISEGKTNIERNIKLVDMIVKGQLTMLNTIHVLQLFLPKLKMMEQYNPPAFELSRSYLNSLHKDIESQKLKSKKSKSKSPKPKRKRLDSKNQNKRKKQRIKK